MATRNLYATFYRPRYGNYQHWALYLEHDSNPLVFEVTGSHGIFARSITQKKPEISSNYLGCIFIDIVNEGDIPELLSTVENATVDNETVEWDCQDYVIEIVEALGEACVVDEEAGSYEAALAELKERRGANP